MTTREIFFTHESEWFTKGLSGWYHAPRGAVSGEGRDLSTWIGPFHTSDDAMDDAEAWPRKYVDNRVSSTTTVEKCQP